MHDSIIAIFQLVVLFVPFHSVDAIGATSAEQRNIRSAELRAQTAAQHSGHADYSAF